MSRPEHLRPSLSVSVLDIDLRVIGLLKPRGRDIFKSRSWGDSIVVSILWCPAPENVTIINYSRNIIFSMRWLLKMSCAFTFTWFSLSSQYIVHSYQYGVVLCCFFCNLIPFLLVLALRIQAANWKSEQFWFRLPHHHHPFSTAKWTWLFQSVVFSVDFTCRKCTKI